MTTPLVTPLTCIEGSKRAYYNIHVDPEPGGTFRVYAIRGRIGETTITEEKGQGLSLEAAMKKHDALVKEKTHKSPPYKLEGKVVEIHRADPKTKAPKLPDGLPSSVMLLKVIEKHECLALIATGRYLLQPKHDGHRVIITLVDGRVIATKRNGDARDLPKGVAKYLEAQFADQTIVVDGELIDQEYVVFDVLLHNKTEWFRKPAEERAAEVTRLFTDSTPVIATVTAYRPDECLALFNSCYDHGCEGVVAKVKRAPYASGRTDKGLKMKFWNTASVVIMGPTPDGKSSVMLGVYTKGKLIHIGDTSINGKGEAPKDAICDVKYLNLPSADGHLYQPEFIRLRDDIPASDCTVEQLHIKGSPRKK